MIVKIVRSVTNVARPRRHWHPGMSPPELLPWLAPRYLTPYDTVVDTAQRRHGWQSFDRPGDVPWLRRIPASNVVVDDVPTQPRWKPSTLQPSAETLAWRRTRITPQETTDEQRLSPKWSPNQQPPLVIDIPWLRRLAPQQDEAEQRRGVRGYGPDLYAYVQPPSTNTPPTVFLTNNAQRNVATTGAVATNVAGTGVTQQNAALTGGAGSNG